MFYFFMTIKKDFRSYQQLAISLSNCTFYLPTEQQVIEEVKKIEKSDTI